MSLNKNSYRVDDFYHKFNLSGFNYFKDLGTNEKSRKVNKVLYRKILVNYFKNYFYEVFFLNKPMYFFLGGLMRLCRFGNKVVTIKNKKALDHMLHNVGLFWYNRPSQRFLFSMKLKKQKGSTNRMSKLEAEWKAENEITFLPLFLKLKKQHFQNKTYFQT